MRMEYEKQEHFLVVKVIGEWTDRNVTESIDKLKAEAEKTGLKKILLNLLELSHPENQVIRHNSGKKIAETLPFYKIAGFAQPEKINYLGEITATNRGANFKMFDAESEAINWLVAD